MITCPTSAPARLRRQVSAEKCEQLKLRARSHSESTQSAEWL